MRFSFRQVDVFSNSYPPGNPVAVVHNADSLDDSEMQSFANWTNLSETTFLLAPTDPAADYRVRIFTPVRELTFAGHPTIGTAHAWLEDGGKPATPGTLVQQCAAGRIRIKRSQENLYFKAPPLIRSGPLDNETLQKATECLCLNPRDVVGGRWVDNGAGWLGLLLPTATAVLDVLPDRQSLVRSGLKIGIAGPYVAAGRPADIEVRAFGAGDGSREDPVTGSLNAGLASWLIEEGHLPTTYTARQGTAVGRNGLVHIEAVGKDYWVGGATRTVIDGSLSLPPTPREQPSSPYSRPASSR